MKRETARFTCTDADGHLVTIIELTKIHSSTNLAGAKGTWNGATELITSDGLWANELENGAFELKDGRIVRRKVEK